MFDDGEELPLLVPLESQLRADRFQLPGDVPYVVGDRDTPTVATEAYLVDRGGRDVHYWPIRVTRTLYSESSPFDSAGSLKGFPATAVPRTYATILTVCTSVNAPSITRLKN